MCLRNLHLIFSFCLLNLVSAQQIDLDQFKSMKFRNIGPAGMSGRITAVDVDLSNEKRIFLGAASGGVWLSENGGISFQPVFDEQSSLSIGAIKINQKNPAEIWVGTGEGNPRNSLNTGNGIYKSIDGGKTWKNMGLVNTKTIHRIIIHRDNPDIVYAAALGSPWGPNDDRGVFKTTDGGKSWKKILFSNSLTGCADLISDPSNPNKLIAAMWEHERKPWFFNSGGKGSGLHVTYDGGENWKKISSEDGLPKGDLGRIGLAMSASKPNIVYALIEAKENGLYKSEDGGIKWKLVSTKNIGNRPFYYNELYVDPKNENRIYNVYTYLSKSEDGGKTFTEIANYGNAVHPDHHAFWIHPENPEFIVEGNDGGAAISRDGGNTWTFISNLPVGQFYHVNIDNDFPYNVYGGMQDNGSWIGPSSVLKSGGIRNSDFQELYFGDGFDVVPMKDSRYGYAMSQGGSLGYYDRVSGFTKFIQPQHGETFLRYNWNAAIAKDPFNDCGVFYGSQFVHYSKDCGDNWTILSPDLTTNDSTKQKQNITGGLTPDATGAENHTTILAIAPSLQDKNTIWVGTDDGNLQMTKDFGKTWQTRNSRLKDMPKNAWIPQIEVSKHNANEVFVVVNDYRRNNYSAFAYHTENAGNTWSRIADDSQIKGFVLSIVQDPKEPNLLFLGTDAGLYVSFNKGKNWQHINKGFPQVQVTDMKIHEGEADLVISTFGRALWILDDITPLRQIAKSQKAFNDDLKLFPTNTAYDVNYRSYDGVRFYAQGDFTGDNENKGSALVYVWSKPKSKDAKILEKPKDVPSVDDKSKDNKKDEKAKIYIIDKNGDTIRHTSVKLEGGLEKIYWGFNQDGQRGPGRREIDKEEDPPGNFSAVPGIYKMILSYKGQKDSTIIDYRPDPRLSLTQKDYVEKLNAQKEFGKIQKSGFDLFEEMKSMKKQIKMAEALLPFQDDSVKTKIEKYHKTFKSKLDSIESIYFVGEDAKGYVYDEDKLNSMIGTASFLINSSGSGFTTNSRTAADKVKKKINSTIDSFNDIKVRHWQPYKSFLTSLGLKLFKEEKTVSRVE